MQTHCMFVWVCASECVVLVRACICDIQTHSMFVWV